MRIPFCHNNELRHTLNDKYRMNEKDAVEILKTYVTADDIATNDIEIFAKELIDSIKKQSNTANFIEEFILQYDLSVEEGILMMCLAETLLRVPDKDTEILLLKDKLTSARWEKYLHNKSSYLVNLATKGLALSGKILSLNDKNNSPQALWYRLVKRSSEPVIRKAIREAMKILSKQFVLGQTIEEAIKKSIPLKKQGYVFSYDMLGEVALTAEDADRYFNEYYHAITVLGDKNSTKSLLQSPSISIKLSALCPRYEYMQRSNSSTILIERLLLLSRHAKIQNISLAIDAEEANRLDMSLDVIYAVFCDPELKNWNGFGIALQAYQKRAFYLLDWLIDLARNQQKRLQIRLVKGAYWDTEIKLSQIDGLEDYPVFTRKVNTDLSYLACAKKMLLAHDVIDPQFATHNAYTAAAIITMMQHYKYQDNMAEFQSLYGMGRSLHNELIVNQHIKISSRIYVPVGNYQDLLPYLVRRLLENGSSSSFVHLIADPTTASTELLIDPIKKIEAMSSISNTSIPLPRDIFGIRKNSFGFDFSNIKVLKNIHDQLLLAQQKNWEASSFLQPISSNGNGKFVYNPADNQLAIGKIMHATTSDVYNAIEQARQAFVSWSDRPVQERATILYNIADLFEAHAVEFFYLLTHEAGKTLLDAAAELREAVDFCRYYACEAEKLLEPQNLLGYTGETNTLFLRGRGVFFCISPWNFPLAIFIGQVTAALVTGNTVLAKPALKTALVAALAVKLCYEAGVPKEVLHFLPGDGANVGSVVMQHDSLAGVIFTGSNATAKNLSQALSNRPGAILPLIAETGGINAMIADSTALPEQLVRDVMISAFGSVGQRCSALRVLFVQNDIADKVLTLLQGAMAELIIGDPSILETDIGPVIDAGSKADLMSYIESMQSKNNVKLVYQCTLSEACKKGFFVPPTVFELDDVQLLSTEIFGPVLHIIRFSAHEIDKIIADINRLGYGLTFGIQSRINNTIEYIKSKINAGNIYINRNMIGAIVGLQPFGGSRLSGTGPKAGGPHYLLRLSQEVVYTNNITAIGGNTQLMSMHDD